MGLGALGEVSFRERAGADLAWLERFEVIEGAWAGPRPRPHGPRRLRERAVRQAVRPHQPEVQVFDWLNHFLGLLESSGATSERLRIFELWLLQRLGLGPAFDSCVGCGRADLGGQTVRCSPNAGCPV
jgi:hypothetical protein